MTTFADQEQQGQQQNNPAPLPSLPKPQRGSKAVVETIVAKLLMQALNAVTGILTARALLPTGRGQLAAMTLWSMFIAGMTTLGVPLAMVYAIRRWPEMRGSLMTTGLLMVTVLGTLAGLVGAIFLPHWMHQYPEWVVRDAQFLMVITPLCSISFAERSILEAHSTFTALNLTQVFQPAVTIVGLFALFFLHKLTVLSAAIAYAVAIVPVVVYLGFEIRPLLSAAAKPTVAAAKLLLGYGIRAYGSDLLGTLAFQVDQILVITNLTPADMGSYVVMLSLSRMFNIFQNSVSTVLFPKTAGESPEKVLEMVGRAARVSVCITGAATASVAIVGPTLMRIFYGKDYTTAIGCLRLLLVEVTVSGLTQVLSQAFFSLGRPGINTILQGIGLSLSVPLMVVLIPRYGLDGAAASLLVSTIARLVLVCFSFPRFLHVKLPSLRPRIADFEMLLRSIRRRKPQNA